VKHYKARYEGEQEAIVERPQWERIQATMKEHNNGAVTRISRSETTPLRGIVFCGHCRSVLTPTYTKKRGKKYTYFFCQQHARNPEHHCPLRRIPAGELEEMILKLLSGVLQTPTLIRETLAAIREGQGKKVAELRVSETELREHLQRLKNGLIDGTADLDEVKKTGEQLAEVRKDIRGYNFDITGDDIMAAMRDTHALWNELFPAAKFEIMKILISKVVVYQDKIQLTINLEGLNRLIGELSVSQYFREEHEKSDEVEMEITQTVNGDGQLSLEMPIQTKKVDGHCRIVHPFGGDTPKQDSIIRAIRRAQLWEGMLCDGEAKNVAELSKKVGFKEGYVRQLLTLNNLAPDIVSAILAGNEPDGLSLARLRRGFPDNWAEQRRALGFE
jgi:site-specific DNA recombinase